MTQYVCLVLTCDFAIGPSVIERDGEELFCSCTRHSMWDANGLLGFEVTTHHSYTATGINNAYWNERRVKIFSWGKFEPTAIVPCRESRSSWEEEQARTIGKRCSAWEMERKGDHVFDCARVRPHAVLHLGCLCCHGSGIKVTLLLQIFFFKS